jgi:hypothetical protein
LPLKTMWVYRICRCVTTSRLRTCDGVSRMAPPTPSSRRSLCNRFLSQYIPIV